MTCLETRPQELGGWQALNTDRTADRSCWLPQALCPPCCCQLALSAPPSHGICMWWPFCQHPGSRNNETTLNPGKAPRPNGVCLGVAGPCVTWAETRSLRRRAKAGGEQGMNAPSASLTNSGCIKVTHLLHLSAVCGVQGRFQQISSSKQQ